MLNNVSGNVIFYVPVQRNYLSRWEYYRVDKRMLEETFAEVIVASNFWQFFKAIISKKTKLVYFWWWHRSPLVALVSRMLGVKCVGTGAVRMYDESGATDFFKKSYLFRLTNRLSWRLANATLFISVSQFRKLPHMSMCEILILKSSTLHTVTELTKTTNRFDRDQKIRLMTVCWLTKDQLIRKSLAFQSD